jgi:hypothetical protein
MNLDDLLRHHLTQTLDTASLPEGDPTVAMARGAALRRRKTQMTVALAAASVVLIVGVGAVVQQVAGDGGKHRDETPTNPVPQAPDGMRLVGMGQVVVAVPERWSTGDTACGIPGRETVYFPSYDADTFVDCLAPEVDQPGGSLAIMSVDSLQGRDLASVNLDEGYGALSDETINGLAVKRGFHGCPPQAPFCPYASEVMVVPEAGVVFVVSAADERLNPTNERSAVLDSVRALPDGFTTVPYVAPGTPRSAAEATLEEAGLDPVAASDVNGPVLDTDPVAGSVLRLDDPVSLDIGGADESATPSVPSAMKLVGMRRAVVAVPDSWGTEKTKCGQPTSDTIYFDPDGRDCFVDQAGISSLLILDQDSTAGRQLASQVTTEAEINGISVLRGPPECGDTDLCDQPYGEIVVIPEQRVVFAIPAKGEGAEVLDSLQLLPEGYTTVPYIALGTELQEAERLIQDAGLVVEVQAPENGDAIIRVTFASPQAGIAYSVGGTVTLDVEVGDDGELDPVERQRVSLPTHCGVNAITVDGTLWLASPPLRGDPDEGWGFNSTPGWFTVNGSDTALFEGDQGQLAMFRRAPPGTEDPNSSCY